MAFAIVVLIFALIAIATGGSIKNLKNIRFRHSWLVLAAVSLKIITNSGLRYTLGISDALAPKIYIGSLLLVIIFIFLNIHLRGLVLIGLGLLSNFLAIISNSGYMPVKREYLVMISTAEELEKINQGLPIFNHIATGPETKLYFLSDIFLMPFGIMITRVFSIGDVILTIGGVVFVWTCLKPARSGKKITWVQN